MSEIKLQSQCFQFAWNIYPESRYMFFSVPNESKRSLILAQQLKASGMISGIPDMILIHHGHVYGFEFKDGKSGVLSQNQKKVHEIWMENGIKVFTIRFFSEFSEIFRKIMTNEG